MIDEESLSQTESSDSISTSTSTATAATGTLDEFQTTSRKPPNVSVNQMLNELSLMRQSIESFKTSAEIELKLRNELNYWLHQLQELMSELKNTENEVHKKCQYESAFEDLLDSDTIINYAKTLYSRGNYKEALKLNEIIYDRQKHHLGEDHEKTLSTEHHLACCLQHLQEYKKSISVYATILEKRNEVLGPDHPDTLKTQYCIATVLEEQQKYKEALHVFKSIYKKRKQNPQLGPDHPSTLDAQFKIAHCLEALQTKSKQNKSLKLLKTVYKKRNKILGETHRDTIEVQLKIGAILKSQGKYRQAMRIYREVYKKQKEREMNLSPYRYGQDYLDALESQSQIAFCSSHLNPEDGSRAWDLYMSVLRKRRLILGPNHEDTLTTEHNLGVVLKSQNKYRDALTCFRDVYNRRKTFLGLDHVSTIESQHLIGACLDKMRKHDEALDIFREVLQKRAKILGEKHPATKEVKRDISQVLRKQKRCRIMQGEFNISDLVAMLPKLGNIFLG